MGGVDHPIAAPVLPTSDPDLAKFTNLQATYYWSASEYQFYSDNAWTFSFGTGYQYAAWKRNKLYALAVSLGDVGIAAVPEPETYTMMLVGLGLVDAMARRRKLAKV